MGLNTRRRGILQVGLGVLFQDAFSAHVGQTGFEARLADSSVMNLFGGRLSCSVERGAERR